MKKVISLIFVIIFLLITLIPLNSFADETIPDLPPRFVDVNGDGKDDRTGQTFEVHNLLRYWVICKLDPRHVAGDIDYICIYSKEPFTVERDENTLNFGDSINFSYLNNNWVYGGISYGSGSFDFITIYKSNHDIAYKDGSGFYKEVEGVDFRADVNIITPRDGFVDNIDTFKISVITDFNRILTDEEIGNIRIEVLLNSEKTDGEVVYNKMSKTALYSTNELSFVIEVPAGLNEVEVIYYYEGASGDVILGSDSVTFERLLGFVDEDGDGLDDRTGQPKPYIPEKPYEPGEVPNMGGAVSGMVQFLSDATTKIGQVSNVINVTFGFLPAEIRWLLYGMILIGIVVAIINLIRGH